MKYTVQRFIEDGVEIEHANIMYAISKHCFSNRDWSDLRIYDELLRKPCTCTGNGFIRPADGDDVIKCPGNCWTIKQTHN